MLVIILLGLGVACLSVRPVSESKTFVVFCSSYSCAYNRRARCTRKEVAIYDNMVIGLCLYHSETMGKRILEPIGKLDKPTARIVGKMTTPEDEVVKDPKAFTNWMKKHGMDK